MAIKAKMKAKALGPWFMDFWSIFWPASWILACSTSSQTFMDFQGLLVPKMAGVRFADKKYTSFFQPFCTFQPPFLAIKGQHFGFFYLIRIKPVIVHN